MIIWALLAFALTIGIMVSIGAALGPRKAKAKPGKVSRQGPCKSPAIPGRTSEEKSLLAPNLQRKGRRRPRDGLINGRSHPKRI